tara:strand:+ start:1685 stop:2515 length:831 start_codon:yes stop_codon:yes gene_type:complete
MNNFLQILVLIRFHNLLLGAGAVFVAAYLLNATYNLLLIQCMLIVITSMAIGYITNDILDKPSDLVNHPQRPLVVGNIKYRGTLFILIFIWFCLLFNINMWALFFLLMVVVPLLSLYNLYLKKLPLIGNIIISFLLGAVFVFTELMLFNTFHQLLIPFFLTMFFSFLREMLKDLLDYDGDLLVNMKTMPIVIGKKITRYLIVLWILCLLILFLLPYFYYNYNFQYLILLLIFIEIPLIFSLFLLIKFPSKRTYKILIQLLKSLCLIGLLIIMITKN